MLTTNRPEFGIVPIFVKRSVVQQLTSLAVLFAFFSTAVAAEEPKSEPADAEQKISFHSDIAPMFRKACYGCHQSGKRQGDYLMTDFAALLSGGETGQPAIVPGDPDASYLLAQITPVDGVAEMPQAPWPALSPVEVAKVRDWIAQGAVNDSPTESGPRFDADNPPVYVNAPSVTSVDVSADGSRIAIAGHHEVILLDAATGQQVARLVGLSPRINTVRFAPDSTRLAVAAGTPSESGELQVWDVAAGELALSLPVSSDSLSGVCWSPDGSQIAFGSVNIVRAVDSQTGEEVLFQGAHEDWVMDVAYTPDGKHLVSVARDMTCKLTEVATQRFIDNVTSITPGALSGGLNSIDSHPERNEILVGGADGVAKVYRVFRETARKIGDDANLIRALPALPGRIFSVSVSPDGSKLAAAATIEGKSEIRVWNYNFGGATPPEIGPLAAKPPAELTPEEKEVLNAYRQIEGSEVWRSSIDSAAIYAIRFSPDNGLVASGTDGLLRRFDPAGEPVAEWAVAPALVPEEERAAAAEFDAVAWSQVVSQSADGQAVEPTLAPEQVVSIAVLPKAISLDHPLAYNQLIVTAELVDGSTVDVTRRVDLDLPALVTADSRRVIRPLADGQATLTVRLGDQSQTLPLIVTGLDSPGAVDFIRDVNPVLSRLGCNQGTCHGAQAGKNGFKLSLRGYDPIFDIRALTDDHAARRINPAAPDDSLMLRKPLGLTPHQGGAVMTHADPYHTALREWIANGSKLDLTTPRVTRIEITPTDPVVSAIGSRQQVRVVAYYADGYSRDVTREAFVTSGNTEVAEVDNLAALTAIRRGEAPILARYEGAYAASTLTVMGERSEFQWVEPAAWGPIDELVASKWQRMKVLPSDLANDAEFLRRVHLDLTGLPPTADQVRAFLADETPTRQKRAAVVDQLLAGEAFIEFWTNKWADLLQVNRKFLGAEGSAAYREWIRASVAENKPYDQFVHEILTASGSNKDNPAASYYKVLRDPDEIMENTTHLFLGIRFNCNKCHDHPFERWTQDQYYETAAFFARTRLRADPASGEAKIGGTAVEGAKPLYEEVFDAGDGEITHERTGQKVQPEFPFAIEHTAPESGSRREQLATWLTHPDNPYFAKSYVNRLWAYMMGVGLIEPIDDIRAGNPPTNPELLDHLTSEFVDSGFDIRQVMRSICNSRTYQLSVVPNDWNADDTQNFARATPRRLPAEVLYDTIHFVTGSVTEIPGVPRGTRAAALPDVGLATADGFLQNLGQPVRESACECERSSDLQLGPIMALVSGPTVGHAISDDKNALAKLVADLPDDPNLVEELYLRILGRSPTPGEVATFADFREAIARDHEELSRSLAERQAWWDEEFAKREAVREESLAAARAELESKTEELRPAREQQEAARNQRIADAEAKLEATRQAQREAWYGRSPDEGGVAWFPISPTEMKTSNGDTFRILEDRSILVSGKAEKGFYELTFETPLTQITGIRLEALTHESLKSQGPGLSENGNFVVTELEAVTAAAATPDVQQPIAFSRAVADFSQSGFAPEQAINGNRTDQQGWAAAGSLGQPHWLVVQAKEPIAGGRDQRITIRLHQVHNAVEHRLGRFRISLCVDPQETIPLGLAEPLATILRTPAEQRTEADLAYLHSYIDSTDEAIKADVTAVAAAKAAVPKDPAIVAIEQRIAKLSVVTPTDPLLERLRTDVEQSAQQQQQVRLTAAEDLTWALINSPAFLFNR
ncbi:MAG: DUF1549 domain-containing protein [Planctomycetaceae bacterium]|nr:MAG: DUF1549 domain-containing protein [Planctomycetaceae bacterium]